MKPEEKDLLLKDLCARLPHGVHIWTNDKKHLKLWSVEPDENDVYWVNGVYEVDEVKPYLRPMSSMTEEEREFLNRKALENSLKCIEEEDPQKVFFLRVKQDVEELAYLYEHHYDVNGLIPIDCAIEVTEENNPYND